MEFSCMYTSLAKSTQKFVLIVLRNLPQGPENCLGVTGRPSALLIALTSRSLNLLWFKAYNLQVVEFGNMSWLCS